MEFTELFNSVNNSNLLFIFINFDNFLYYIYIFNIKKIIYLRSIFVFNILAIIFICCALYAS